jgi:hypothetical protein
VSEFPYTSESMHFKIIFVRQIAIGLVFQVGGTWLAGWTLGSKLMTYVSLGMLVGLGIGFAVRICSKKLLII